MKLPRRVTISIVATLAALTQRAPAYAWTVSEHAHIGDSALHLLRAEHPPSYEVLAQAWRVVVAAEGATRPLCPDAGASSAMFSHDRDNPTCVTLEDLPALAADHACRPHDLDQLLQDTSTAIRAGHARPWLIRALIDGRVSHGNLVGPVDDPRRDADRDDLNLDLTIHDPAYVDRAQSNLSHFTVRRHRLDTFEAWFQDALARPGENLPAAFARFHLAALRLAAWLRPFRDDPAAAPQLWQMILFESFALHFLEDAFAGGHLATDDPDGSLRAGIHDAYCTSGFVTHTWRQPGASFRAYGDAHLTREDEARAAHAVAMSWQQVLDVLQGTTELSSEAGLTVLPPDAPPVDTLAALDTPLHALAPLDVCQAQWTRSAAPWTITPELTAVLRETPEPALVAAEDVGPDAVVPYRSNHSVFIDVPLTLLAGASLTADDPSLGGVLGPGIGFSLESVLSNYRSPLVGRANLLVGMETSQTASAYLVGFHVELPVLLALPWIVTCRYCDSATSSLAHGLAPIQRYLSWTVGRDVALQVHIAFLREGVNVYWAIPVPNGQADPHARRVELQAPLLTGVWHPSLTTTTRTVSDVALSLGGRVAWLSNDAVEAGLYLSLTAENRIYVGWP